MKLKVKPIWLLFSSVFFDSLGYGLLIPIYFFIFQNPNSEFNFFGGVGGAITYNLVLASFSVSQFFATPILGQLSDKFGRKKILSLSLFGTLISHILFIAGIFLHFLPFIFIARTFDGLSGGNLSVVQATISDLSIHKKQKDANFTFVGIALAIGNIIGPFLGSILIDYNLLAPSIFIICFAFSNFFLIQTRLNLPYTNQNTKLKIDWNESLDNLVLALKLHKFRNLLVTNFLFQLGFAFFTTIAIPFFVFQYNFKESTATYFVAIMALSGIFGQLILRFSKLHITNHKLLSSSLLGSSFSIILFLVADKTSFFGISNFWIILISSLFGIFITQAQISIISLVADQGQKDTQGQLMGTNTSVQAFAQAIPPIFTACLIAIIAQVSGFTNSIFILISGILVLFSFIYYFITHGTGQKSS
jgi:MFS family permease